MQIHSLRAATGWRWVRDGFLLLRRQPIALLAIVFLNLMLLSLSVLIPLFGTVAPLVLTPVLMVGLMHAVRAADSGRMPTPGLLFAGFRDAGGTAWRPLLVLGAVNAAATLAALAVAALADGGMLLKLATGQAHTDEPGAADASLVYAALVFVLIYIPVQMALWYAPLLIAWHRVPPLKALFFSFVAVLRNKGAFAIYAVGWFVLAFVASLGIRVLDAALSDSPIL
ncbi:MAG: BPSS1780 family membrane protein, partial [Gammaproteobacteria bacterium]